MNYNIAKISGGTFESSSTVIINTHINDTMDKGQLSISGGTFTHTKGGEIINYNHNEKYGSIGTVSITKGNFSNDVSNYAAEGYTCVKSGSAYKVGEAATKVTLDQASATLKVGQTTKLNVTVEPSETVDKIKWTSSDEKIVTVDQDGNVKAVSNGNATITATAGLIKAVCKVNVVNLDLVVDVPKVDTSTPVEKVEVGVSDKKSEEVLLSATSEIINNLVQNNVVSETYMSTETQTAVKKALAEGKAVSSKVETKTVKETEIDKTVLKEIKTLVSKSATENKNKATIAEYLDLEVLLVADNEELGTMNSLTNSISFTVALPKNLVKDGRLFYVVRVHDGQAEKLSTSLNEDGTLTFQTDKFSTYALVYEEVIDAQPIISTQDDTTKLDNGAVKTEDNSLSSIYAAICGMAVLAGGIVLLKKKKEELMNK